MSTTERKRSFTRVKRKTNRRTGRNGRSGRNQEIVPARVYRGLQVAQGTTPLFPAQTTRRLRYSDNFQLVSSGGAVASYVFAMNGLYDPNITGTGHQPMGFDEMMIYFNHYCVVASSITVCAKGLSATKLTWTVRQDGAATPITVIDRIVEIGGGVIAYIDASASANDQSVMKLPFNIAKLQGVDRRAMTADSSLRGTSAANPSELTYAHVQVWDAAAQTGTVNFDVIIDFVAVFTEPRDASASAQLMRTKIMHEIAQLSLGEETKHTPKK